MDVRSSGGLLPDANKSRELSREQSIEGENILLKSKFEAPIDIDKQSKISTVRAGATPTRPVPRLIMDSDRGSKHELGQHSLRPDTLMKEELETNIGNALVTPIMISSKVANPSTFKIPQRNITPKIMTDLSAIAKVKHNAKQGAKGHRLAMNRGEKTNKNSIKIKEAKVDDYFGAYGVVDSLANSTFNSFKSSKVILQKNGLSGN